jgi:hypothetical protein
MGRTTLPIKEKRMTIHRRVVMTAAAVLAAAAAGGGIAVAQGGLAARAGHGKASFKLHATRCPTGARALRQWQRLHPRAQCLSIHSHKADVDPSTGDRARSEGETPVGNRDCEQPNEDARESRDQTRGDDNCLGDNEAAEEEAAEEEAPAPAASTSAANFAG